MIAADRINIHTYLFVLNTIFVVFKEELLSNEGNVIIAGESSNKVREFLLHKIKKVKNLLQFLLEVCLIISFTMAGSKLH